MTMFVRIQEGNPACKTDRRKTFKIFLQSPLLWRTGTYWQRTIIGVILNTKRDRKGPPKKHKGMQC